MESLFRKLIHGQKNPPDNRRFAAYFLALQILRVQFALSKYQFCQGHFSFIDRAEQCEVDRLPKAWHVGVHYYRGRYKMFNNDFSEAKHELKKAFQLCHRDQFQNKQRILRYLVPVEMTYGKFPTDKMIETYEL